jgi:subtilase family serine protease
MKPNASRVTLCDSGVGLRRALRWHSRKILGSIKLVLVGALLLGMMQLSAAAQAIVGSTTAPDEVTLPVDPAMRITLLGNTRPEATTQNDLGAVPDSFPMPHMMLQLKRSPAQERALETLIDQLHSPVSPNFHKWLTAAQMGRQFGLATADLKVIAQWLADQGFQINDVYPSGMLIDFSGTAGQVHTAFATQIHNLSVDGVRHWANMSDPQIPAALAPAVAGIVSLNDFRPRAAFTRTNNYKYQMAPADLATIYNFNPLFAGGFAGQGQTVALAEDSDMTNSDWSTFRDIFGLSGYSTGSLTVVHPGSNCTDPGVAARAGETTLDAEWASAAAPGAAILVAPCEDAATWGVLIATENLVNSAPPPPIISISYEACETSNGAAGNAAIFSAYQQAVAEGVSIFVAAGDQGAAWCNWNTVPQWGIGINGLASTPYNVAVGGTDFGDTYAGTNSTYWSATNSPTYGSALSYVPEIPWNDTCGSQLLAKSNGFTTTYGSQGFCNSAAGSQYLWMWGGSGGASACGTGSTSTPNVISGTCQGYPKPSWQAGVLGLPNDGLRDLPDLSLFSAGNGVWGHSYVFCYSSTTQTCGTDPNTWGYGYGTSFASPIMAGLQAIVNQYTGAQQGNPNYTYYPIAGVEYGASGSSACNSSNGNSVGSSCVFYDVTLGDDDVPCTGSINCYLSSGTYGVLSTSGNSYEPAFETATGWDFATGIGTVNAYNLVNSWPANTTTLTLSSSAVNAGTASVTLAAKVKVVSGNTSPTGTVTFYANGAEISQPDNPVALTASSAGVATLSYNTSSLTGGTYSITANYNPSGSFGPSTSPAVPLEIQDFTLAANPATVTVSSPGESGSASISLTDLGGFNQTLSFACASGLPSEATCSFASVSGGVTLTVATTAPSAALREMPLGRRGRLFYAMLLPGLLGLLCLGEDKRFLRRARLLAAILLLGLCLPFMSCGGSGNGGGGGGNSGTPAGTSQVTVTGATTGSTPLSHSLQITLKVL